MNNEATKEIYGNKSSLFVTVLILSEQKSLDDS